MQERLYGLFLRDSEQHTSLKESLLFLKVWVLCPIHIISHGLNHFLGFCFIGLKDTVTCKEPSNATVEKHLKQHKFNLPPCILCQEDVGSLWRASRAIPFGPLQFGLQKLNLLMCGLFYQD
jgi:hypothetical protein